MIEVARELVAVARMLADDDDLSTGLNGMSNPEARKFVNKLLQKHTRGSFFDDGWKPIHKTFKELSRHAINYSIDKTWYTRDDRDQMDSKTWEVTTKFLNNKGRETTIYIRIVASGGGDVKNPLSRYDVAAYAS